MTTAQILEQVATGKISAAEANVLIAENTASGGKEFAVEVGEYNGNKTLGFSGNFKPWRKGAASIANIARDVKLGKGKSKVLAALVECGYSEFAK